MRALPLLIVPLLAGCTATPVGAPSLAPRAAEAIDPRVPVPDPPIPTTPAPGLVEQLDRLVAQANAGDQAFQPLADHARRLAGAAGPKESESWVVAQQALSAAVAARAPVASAVGDIDALGAQRIKALGGISAGDLMAIDRAAARVGGIDNREAAAIDDIQRLLSR
jgi:hypothetical protein